MTEIRYRPDIDGLRAVAVIPVVLFHLGILWMPGGFIGVDVFFVISGYLIASIIARELNEGRFSLLRFYERRIRRIFPALFFMMAVVLVVATFLFTLADLNAAGKSAFAATFFASNILFWSETGYFDASAYAKPLLHTWSLAIEEQFYLFLPLILMAVAAWKRNVWRNMAIWVTGLTVVSFILSAFFTNAYPEAAYYLIPWRAWELGVGAMLALDVVPRIRHAALRQTAGIAGLALILVTALVIDKAMTFPGVLALAPVLGAALIIQAGRDGDHIVARLLSTGPAVLIGKLSYSLYLWHWPIMVFFVYWTFSFPGLIAEVLLFVVSLCFAWLSWRYVEQPFRHGKAGARQWPVFVGGGSAMVIAAGFGAMLSLMDGLPNRLSPEAAEITQLDTNRLGAYRACFADKMDDETWLDPCLFGSDDTDVPARVALWSDSHGPSYLPGIAAAAEAWGERVALYGHDGCPGVVGIEVHWVGNDHSCTDFITDTFGAIMDDPNIQLVIYAMRSPIYAQGWVEYGLAERDRKPLFIGAADGPLLSQDDREPYFLTALERTINQLEEAGKTVAVIYPLPEAGVGVPSKVIRAYVRGQEPEAVTLPRELFDARSASLIAGFDAIAAETGMVPVRVYPEFCDDTDCDLTLDGIPIFTDSNHLTPAVAVKLAPLFDSLFSRLAEAAQLNSIGEGG